MTYKIEFLEDKFESMVKCPVCDYEYVHQLHPKTTYDTRQEGIKIEMYCEKDHKWVIYFEEHKGNIFTRVEILTK